MRNDRYKLKIAKINSVIGRTRMPELMKKFDSDPDIGSQWEGWVSKREQVLNRHHVLTVN